MNCSTFSSDNRVTDPSNTGASYKWAILVTCFLTTSVGFMLWGEVFPLLAPFVKSLGITRAQGGTLFAIYYLPGLIVSLPGGRWFDRYPYRRLFAGCWAAIVAGALMMAMATGFPALCAGRLLLCAGLQLHQIGAPKLLSAWFQGSRFLGLATGLYTCSFTLGTFASLAILSHTAEIVGLQAALNLLVVLSLCALIVVLTGVRAPSSAPAVETVNRYPSYFSLSPAIWLIAVLYLCFTAAIDSFYTFTPDYLVTRGFSVSRASYLVGISTWLAFTLKPIVSLLLTRASALLFVLIASAASLCSYVLLAPGRTNAVVTSALIGVSLALAMPAFTALPAFLLPSDRTGQGYGACQLLYSFGFLAQPLIGYSIDHTTRYTVGFLSMGFGAAITFAGATFLLLKQKTALAFADT